MNRKKKIKVAAAALAVLAASGLGLAYNLDAAGQQPSHTMTYEEAVRATENDCCK